ncbi:DUF3307 domain-containing protein [bacterium]|nr:DUF3307 domain-containing protein [bacterium]
MTSTLAALIFAHVLADFVIQTNWIAANKRLPQAMVLHGLAVLVTAAMATGTPSVWLAALTLVHLAIDAVKARASARGLGPFLADQAAHLASLCALAALAPQLWEMGVWAGLPRLAPAMALAAGLILATRGGSFAVGLLMEPWTAEAPKGLPGGGRMIGLLERGLIFTLLLTGQAQGIGYLVAAKSVLRFGAVANEGKLSEYVIIGTLASVFWAIGMAAGTSALLHALPTLGIPDLTP